MLTQDKKYFNLACITLVLGIILFQAIKTLVLFKQPVNIVNSIPMYHCDYSILQYQLILARKFLEETNKLWGYNPYCLNGFPWSPLFNSNIFLQLLGILFWNVSELVLVKVFLFMIIVVEPFFIYFAFRNFGCNELSALISCLILLVYLGSGIGLFLLILGMVTGYIVYLLFFYTMSLLYRYVVTKETNMLMAKCLVAISLSLLVHKTFLVLMFPVCVIIGITLLLKRQYAKLLFCFDAFGIGLVINSFWLLPLLKHWKYADFSYNPYWRYPESIVFFDMMFLGETFYASIPYFLELVMVILGILGWYILFKNKKHFLATISVVTTVILVFLVVLGNSIPWLKGLHNARFYVVIWIILSIPVSATVSHVFKKTPGKYSALMLVGMIGALYLGTRFLPSYSKNVDCLEQKIPMFKFDQNTLPVDIMTLPTWIRTHTSKKHNIFIQYNIVRENVDIFNELWTERRFINAPYYFVYLTHNYVNRYFQDFFRVNPIYSTDKYKTNTDMFTLEDLEKMLLLYPENAKSIRLLIQMKRFEHLVGITYKVLLTWPEPSKLDFNRKDFRWLARFFNVKWWFITDPESKKRIESIKGMKKIDDLGEYTVYKFKAKMSDFLEGSAKLTLGYSRIYLDDIKPKDDQLILKMHWVDNLKVEGATAVEPYYLEKFPLPFIRVQHPSKTAVIYY